MSEKDKMPAHVCQVKVGDSPCAVLERARLRALVDALWDEWEGRFRGSGLKAYHAGALGALDDVLDLLEEDATHE